MKLLSTIDIFKDIGLLILLFAEGLISYFYYQMVLLINMVSLYIFHWQLVYLSITIAIAVTVNFIIVLFTRRYFMSSAIDIYFLFVTGCCIIVLSQSLLFLTIALELNNYFWLQFTLMLLVQSFLMYNACGSLAYMRWLLLRISPSQSASIVESNRYLVAKVCGFFAFLTAGFIFKSIIVVLPLYNFLYYILILILVINRHKILQRC